LFLPDFWLPSSLLVLSSLLKRSVDGGLLLFRLLMLKRFASNGYQLKAGQN